MARHKRGKITVEHQPTDAQRSMVRFMGIFHAVFGAVFVIAALTVILPNAGLFALPFLLGGAFFCINGLRIAFGKSFFTRRVAYDVETEAESEVPVDETAPPTQSAQADYSAAYSGNAKMRLEQLEQLKAAGLITDREYREKREDILRDL